MQDIKKMFRDLAEYGRRWLQEWAEPHEVAMHADAVAVDEDLPAVGDDNNGDPEPVNAE